MSVAFEVLWDALAQYVQNTEDAEHALDERGRAILSSIARAASSLDAAIIATAG